MITWTVGSTGLIGHAIAGRCEQALSGRRYQPPAVPWQDPPAAEEILTLQGRDFAEQAGAQRWAVIWAAGAATVSSSMNNCLLELNALTALVSAIRRHPPTGPGVFFLTSSAGGVYAGSAHPPFDEVTRPAPLSAYGEIKLGQEEAVMVALADVCPIVIGRFSNVYGPGQNLDKLQGLVSRLAVAAATRQPLNIFVSLDTLRDYIYVDDAAALAVALIKDALDEQPSTKPSPTRVIASGEPVSLGRVIRTMEAVTKKRVPLALGSHPSSAGQVHDLRLVASRPRSAHADLPPATPLEAGSRRVYDDILRRLQEPSSRNIRGRRIEAGSLS